MRSRNADIKECPPTLELRLAALESQAETGDDFDAASWCWLIFLGVILPTGLIILGWFI